MSFFLKQAINALTAQTSDIQDILDQKAEASKTYTMDEVNGKFTDLIGAAPVTLDTLKEIASAVDNDASFSIHTLQSIADKAPSKDPTFTGTATFTSVAGITPTMVGLGNVNNTADKDKIVSDKTIAALNQKEAVVVAAAPLVKAYQMGGPDDGKMLLSLDKNAEYAVGKLTSSGTVSGSSFSSSGGIDFTNANQTNIVGKKAMRIGQAGDTQGDSNIYVTNRPGANGLTVENTSATYALVDQVFKTYITSRSIRLENRAGTAKCGAPTFNVGGSSADAPSLAVGDTYCAVANKLTIGSYNARTDPLYVEGSATIAGNLRVEGMIYGTGSSTGSNLRTGPTALTITNEALEEVAKFWNGPSKATDIFGTLNVDGTITAISDLTVNGATTLHTSSSSDVAVISSNGADILRVSNNGIIDLHLANMKLIPGGPGLLISSSTNGACVWFKDSLDVTFFGNNLDCRGSNVNALKLNSTAGLTATFGGNTVDVNTVNTTITGPMVFNGNISGTGIVTLMSTKENSLTVVAPLVKTVATGVNRLSLDTTAAYTMGP